MKEIKYFQFIEGQLIETKTADINSGYSFLIIIYENGIPIKSIIL